VLTNILDNAVAALPPATATDGGDGKARKRCAERSRW
jgi:hypothetical protein